MEFNLLKKSEGNQEILIIFTYSDIKKYKSGEAIPFSAQFNYGKSDPFLLDIIESGEISGNKGEQVLLHTLMIDDFSYKSSHLNDGLKPKRILLYGLGDHEKVLADDVREASAHISRRVKSLKIQEVSVIVESIRNIDIPVAVSSVVEGFTLGSYKFEEFKSSGKKINNEIKTIDLLIEKFDEEIEKSVKIASTACDASLKARDLVNRPPNIVNPEYLKDYSVEMANSNENLSIEVLDKKELEKLEMRTFLGVAQGSKADPYGIILNYLGDPENPSNNIWLIGKGITFDSGGLSLKPSMSMIDMKSDMSGGASVIAAMDAIGKLKPKINVTGLCLATENMPGGGAQRVGDIVTSMNGKTIEIENTDAEGRLTLADAVEFANQRGAAKIIDVATLTGAMVISLGHGLIGAFGNDNDLIETLISAGEKTGEKIWHMPLDDTSKKQNRSKVADIKNTGGRAAGSVTAAHFIGEFVGDTPWVHLDIAGTAMSASNRGWISQGATGYPCRTLIETVFKLSY